jgi:hypothetical protein
MNDMYNDESTKSEMARDVYFSVMSYVVKFNHSIITQQQQRCEGSNN